MTISWNLSNPTGIETTYEYTASTDVRDVSEVLDSVYLADTPLMNRLTWGKPCHNKKIEWISDNIGRGYVVLSNAGDFASGASALLIGTSGLGAISLACRQLNTGTILRTESSTATSSKQRGYLIVNDICYAAGSLVVEYLSGCTCSEVISNATTLYIVGNAVNEASLPRDDKTRPRTLHSNITQIFRQDIRMSGTRTATMMHAVSNELRHQIGLRAMEHKRQLERTMIMGVKDPGVGTNAEARTMGGFTWFMAGESGSHIDTTTTSFTETALNNIMAEVWDRGGTPDTILLGSKQARNISALERSRVRVEQDSRVAGFYVTRYMSDLGAEVDILVSRWVPSNWLLVMDRSKIVPRAMVGRKYLLEKLGKKGDFVEYELICEATLELRGYTQGQHGMMTGLT